MGRVSSESIKILKQGRIDILPGSILLWCDITDKIIELVDWIFKVEHSN